MRSNVTDRRTTSSASDEVWLLNDQMKSLLRLQMGRLPSKEVSEQDTRYPVDAAGMKAFLETFFARHFFQVQRTLMEFTSSMDFQHIRESRNLRILDIGCGPGVASLALYDLMDRPPAPEYGPQLSPPARTVRVAHVLNDTSPICLGMARKMIAVYLDQDASSRRDPRKDAVFVLSTAFPHNLHQIQCVAQHLGGVDVILLSYVVGVLTDHYGLGRVVDAISHLERFCQPHGRIVIIQDKFQISLLEHMAQRLGVQCQERTVTHEIYPRRGKDEKYTYTYCDCLYSPSKI